MSVSTTGTGLSRRERATSEHYSSNCFTYKSPTTGILHKARPCATAVWNMLEEPCCPRSWCVSDRERTPFAISIDEHLASFINHVTTILETYKIQQMCIECDRYLYC